MCITPTAIRFQDRPKSSRKIQYVIEEFTRARERMGLNFTNNVIGRG